VRATDAKTVQVGESVRQFLRQPVQNNSEITRGRKVEKRQDRQRGPPVPSVRADGGAVSLTCDTGHETVSPFEIVSMTRGF